MSKISDKFLKLVRSDGAFKLQNQQVLGQTTVPAGAPKHAKDIAATAPWSGTEAVGDQVLRMLNDSHKKLKPSRQKRLSTAREHALDYRFNEGETYRDRVKPARNTSSGVSTGGSIESIANQHIEDAILRGQFEDLPRGKPIARDTYKMLNPYIDTTELILNRMIKRQGAAPPWILKQGAMHRQVAEFREKITKQIVTMMVHNWDEQGTVVGFKSPCSVAWRAQQRGFHEAAIAQLNSTIRGYNLQAPQSARKGYLTVDHEVSECFKVATERAPMALEVFKGQRQVEQVKVLHRTTRRQEDPANHYGLLDMLGWRKGRVRGSD